MRLAILIEDNESDRAKILKELEARNFRILTASDATQALECFEACPFPDLVVLDWFCEGPEAGSRPAQLVIENVVVKAFAPVAVVTDNTQVAKENMPSIMPAAFCEYFDKYDFDEILKAVDGWSQQATFLMGRLIARAGARAMGRATWHLAKHGDAGLNDWLWFVGNAGGFLETFLRIVRRELDGETSFAEQLSSQIPAAPSHAEPTNPLLLRILSADRYYIPSVHESPMSGDIFRDETGSYFVLINPACDLVTDSEQLPKAERALLIAATPLSTFIQAKPEFAEGKADTKRRRVLLLLKNQDLGGTGLVRTYGLPMVPIGSPDAYSDLVDLVVQFDKLEVLPWDEFARRLGVKRRVARIDSPHAEALLRQFSLFSDRIGLRDIPDPVLMERSKGALGPPS